jgi:hypothetical protein
MEVIMRSFNVTHALSILLSSIALAACGAQIDVQTREDSSVGALQENDDQPSCFTGALQAPNCVDPGDFKLEAYNICLQSNTMLTELQITSACANGLAEEIQYQCCDAPPPPPDAPGTGLPPVPEAPASGCVWESFGDGQTCQDYGQFKMPAYEACALAGLTLTNLYVQNQASCSDWFGTSFVAECCPAPPEPPPAPPPVVCLSGTLGDGQTCQDLGGVKTTAFETCEQAGLMLFNIQIEDLGSCGPSEGLLVSYECAAVGDVCP